jgi:hypothetical protein
MKKIKYILAFALSLIVMSCGDDFLDTKNLYEKLDVDFYSTPEEIQDALTAAYACLGLDAGNNNPILVSELMSDDRFGGGGTNDVGFKDIDAFTNSSEDRFLPLWRVTYYGIFRANMILKRFDQAQYTDENEKNQALGEVYFLRAFFYFRIAQFFGSGPLITDPAPLNLPKASAEELYGQIAFDLKTAIGLMPATPYTSIPVASLGHVTKWAAEGLMARVFLFYTGYYEQSELPLAGGGSVTKQEVIDWVDNCVSASSHGLIPDFRNLWPYSYSQVDYPYAADNDLHWIGEDGANIETVFAIKYSPYGGWNPPNRNSYSNQLTLYMGLRGAMNSYIPFGQGWGGGPVNPQLLAAWDDEDLRKKASILDVTDPDEGEVSTSYTWNGDNNQQETGLYQKKYIPIQVTMGSQKKGMYYFIYGSPDNFQLWNMQDDILIRFADILLMGAELGSSHAQEYLDRVRTRVGLPSVTANLENIKLERRFELAFEGLRYFDLLRWHDAEAAFATEVDIHIKTLNVDTLYTASYRPETGGFLPIPESQVRLSNNVLTQNPGWE